MTGLYTGMTRSETLPSRGRPSEPRGRMRTVTDGARRREWVIGGTRALGERNEPLRAGKLGPGQRFTAPPASLDFATGGEAQRRSSSSRGSHGSARRPSWPWPASAAAKSGPSWSVSWFSPSEHRAVHLLDFRERNDLRREIPRGDCAPEERRAAGVPVDVRGRFACAGTPRPRLSLIHI